MMHLDLPPAMRRTNYKSGNKSDAENNVYYMRKSLLTTTKLTIIFCVAFARERFIHHVVIMGVT